MSREKIVRIGLDVPVGTLFDYRAPDASAADIGCRVRVPFGRGQRIGIVVDVCDDSTVPADKLKRIHHLDRDGPRLGRDDLRLLRFAAEYYHHPLGSVVMATLPARLCKADATERQAATHFVITPTGRTVTQDALPSRALAQRRVLAALQSAGALSRSAAADLASSAAAILKQFVAHGWACEEAVPVPAVSDDPVDAAPPLTAHQRAAVDAITAAGGRYAAFLLLGVTGSGKTEVYLHAIAATLAAGRQALLLVPEIALTPQLREAVAERFGASRLATLHSALNDTERLDNWTAAARGRARIVIGTRLAVFAPLPELGLIIVDEEHDSSFKQSEGLCYSARDLALVRAHQCGVPVVLGSATPALESYYNARRGRYTLLRLPERINAAPPRVQAVDTRHQRLDEGLSPAVIAAVRRGLERGEQSLVFINRRGYAPVLMCHACGWLSGCTRCTAQLVLHLREQRLRCHHCGHDEPVARHCPHCGNAELAPVGQGTQRIEDAFRRVFPEARILRIDRDSTRRKNAWDAMRDDIHAGAVDILIGTQILAKGHDFPRLTFVGVLNADSALYSADFRAAERLFALLMQVSGRAGRGTTPGEVLVQTEFPEHPVFAALATQDASAYADALLAEREQAGFPPFVHQALLRAEAPQLKTALGFLAEAVTAATPLAEGITLYDPVPAPMTRLAGRERAHVLVQADDRQRLHGFLRAWLARLAADGSSRARWALDVDPLEF